MLSAHRAEWNHRFKTTHSLHRKAGEVSSREIARAGEERMPSEKAGNGAQSSKRGNWSSFVAELESTYS